MLAIVAVGNLFIPPSYSASSTLRVATTAAGSTDFVSYDTQYADRLMSTYVKLVGTEGVLAELTTRLGFTKPPKVKADVQANTELIVLTVEAATPTLARDAANTLAVILIEQSKNTLGADDKIVQTLLDQRLAKATDELAAARQVYKAALIGSSEQAFPPVDSSSRDSASRELAKQDVDLREKVYLSVMEQVERARLSESMRVNSISIANPAPLPTGPASPNLLLNLAVGLVAGILSGIGLAILMHRLDTTLYTSKQINEVAQLPVLAQIPTLATRHKRKTHPAHFPPPLHFFKYGSSQLEAVRRLYLRLNIGSANPSSACTVLVTSAEPGEGKSTLIANLATVIAQSGRRVIAVDCDLRRPILHMAFGLFKASGLSDLLLSMRNEINLAQVVSATRIPNLFVLNAGSPTNHLGELVSSPRMAEIMHSLRQAYDVVLLDSPPLLAVSDALALAGLTDITLLVVERGRTKSDIVQTACRMLSDVRAPSVGLVVNRAEPSTDYGYLGAGIRQLSEPNIAQIYGGHPIIGT